MEYKVIESFYSLQGEGMWTGCPAFFVRMAGCNLNCDFCDTRKVEGSWILECDLLKDFEESGASHLVITGGEPTLQNLQPLIRGAHSLDATIHLETNGTVKTNVFSMVNHLTVSPKNRDVQPEAYIFANEVKIPWDGGEEYGVDFVDSVVNSARWRRDQRLYLQPINGEKEINWENVRSALQYVKERADLDLSVSMQMHKLWKVR